MEMDDVMKGYALQHEWQKQCFAEVVGKDELELFGGATAERMMQVAGDTLGRCFLRGLGLRLRLGRRSEGFGGSLKEGGDRRIPSIGILVIRLV